MNVESLKRIGTDIAVLLQEYSNGPHREMLLDPTLFAYLRASGRSVERQYHAHLPGAKKPPRIDFRVKSPNAVLIEFAVRPPMGGAQLYGSQNKSELRKLCRFNNSAAKLRALLLVDLHHTPHDKSTLKATYNFINAGKGKFERFPVQVIYTHASTAFSFKWSPYKSS